MHSDRYRTCRKTAFRVSASRSHRPAEAEEAIHCRSSAGSEYTPCLDVEGVEQRAQGHERAAVHHGGGVALLLARQGLQRAGARHDHPPVLVRQRGDQFVQCVRLRQFVAAVFGRRRKGLHRAQGGDLHAGHHVCCAGAGGAVGGREVRGGSEALHGLKPSTFESWHATC